MFSLYSEDASDSRTGCESIKYILISMCQHIEPRIQTHKLVIEPVPNCEKINGTYWKTTTKADGASQERRRRLIEMISTEIKQKKVVVFHVDGDTTWSQIGSSVNASEIVRFKSGISSVLQMSRGGFSENLDHCFIVFMPFYSIESWAYSNTKHLINIVQQGEKAKVIDWEQNLSMLDELSQVKNELSIGSTKNSELFKNKSTFPILAQIQLEKSYYISFTNLSNSPLVRGKLSECI